MRLPVPDGKLIVCWYEDSVKEYIHYGYIDNYLVDDTGFYAVIVNVNNRSISAIEFADIAIIDALPPEE